MDYAYSTGYTLSPEAWAAYLLGNTIILVFALIMAVISIIAYWKIFEKAGYEGWKAIIPFYNAYIMYEIAWGKGKGWMFLLQIIPCIGQIFSIIYLFKLAKAYGQGVGFGFGLLFLNTIFILILGFGSSQYVGPDSPQGY